MTIRNRPEVVAQAPQTNGAAAVISPLLREAALAANEAFAATEVEKHAQAVLDAWKAKLEVQTKDFVHRMLAPQPQMAGPITPGLAGIPYPWLDCFFAGPYQFVPGSGYLPHKVMKANEWAYLLGYIWRNPAPIGWIGGGLSAADVLSAYNFRARFEIVNLTTVGNGPDLGPIDFVPIGGGFLNGFFVLVPPGTFPMPPSGRPNLYEVNLTVDATGPGSTAAGLPFAGYATWLYDPDYQPPTIMSPVWPHWQHEIPGRFMVHA